MTTHDVVAQILGLLGTEEVDPDFEAQLQQSDAAQLIDQCALLEGLVSKSREIRAARNDVADQESSVRTRQQRRLEILKRMESAMVSLSQSSVKEVPLPFTLKKAPGISKQSRFLPDLVIVEGPNVTRKFSSATFVEAKSKSKGGDVIIRLSLSGTKNRPIYNIVVVDTHQRRHGRFIERVGFYNPAGPIRSEGLSIAIDRVKHWLDVGAKLSPAVTQLLDKRTGKVISKIG